MQQKGTLPDMMSITTRQVSWNLSFPAGASSGLFELQTGW
mgnify:CR=1 FL=1